MVLITDQNPNESQTNIQNNITQKKKIKSGERERESLHFEEGALG